MNLIQNILSRIKKLENWYAYLYNNSGGSGGGPGTVTGASVQTITFIPSIPFTHDLTIMEKTLSGNIVFDVNTTGQISGAGATVRLISDGISYISFASSLKRLSTSDDFRAELGTVYLLVAYYDGFSHYYSISKETATETPTAPTLVSITVEEAEKAVAIFTYNKGLDESFVPSPSDYAFPSKTVASVAVLGSKVRVTVTAEWIRTNTITCSYTAGVTPLRGLFGNQVANITAGTAVTNNITTTLANYVEWLTAFDPNLIAVNNGVKRVRSTLANSATNTKTFRAVNQLTSGNYVQFKTPASLGTGQVGVILDSAIVTTTGGLYGLVTVSGNISQRTSGSISTLEAVQLNTYYRIFYNGGLIEYYKSSDNLTYTLIGTAVAVPSGSYYMYVYCSEGVSIEEIKSTVSSGASVPTTSKLRFYTNPSQLTTTLAGYTLSTTGTTVNVSSDGGTQKILLTSGANQATVRYSNPITQGVFLSNSQIKLICNNVNIVSGKLFVKVGALNQSGGASFELTNGNNSFNVDLTSLNTDYLWLTSDAVVNGGGNGFIGEFKIELQ